MRYRVPAWLLIVMVLVIGESSAFAQDASTTDTHSKAFSILASTYVGLNALDVYTTTVSLRSGAMEANRVMAPVAGNPVALAALKGAATTSTILLARRLWKGHRAAAVALLVGANIGMTIVVANNARVAGMF